MSKVLTFSRKFPAYHPKAGQPTYFVEKIAKSLHKTGLAPWDIPDEIFCQEMYYLSEPKNHTIRAGNRFKVGDKFSPRVWSGKPYASKQIIIAPDIEVKKVWDFEIKDENILVNGAMQDSFLLNEIAGNDGLEYNDMMQWFKFPKPFSGQIICWNENVNY